MIDYRNYILTWGRSYFPEPTWGLVDSLPIPQSEQPFCVQGRMVSLPAWANRLGVGVASQLFVPEYCISKGCDEDWMGVDWFRACFDMLTCKFEWEYEGEYSPIHSYFYKLEGVSAERCDHAWVNRILLFLRSWAAHEAGKSEAELFGPLPKGKVHLTHDVDYVKKTPALRLKQAVFSGVNALRSLVSGSWVGFKLNIRKGFRFLFCGADYWQFTEIEKIENVYNVKSQWNIYGGVGGLKRKPTKLLLDPSYNVLKNRRLTEQIISLKRSGHIIGLHQAFHSWKSSSAMNLESDRLEQALGYKVTSCRHHWLRFSFADTWSAQEEAGFTLDTTLGFNDRVGYRNSAALRIPAWIHSENRPSDTLEILPMVLMDSHLFDYGQMNQAERRKVIGRVLDEIQFVGGEVTVIWHHRVFHSDYGWGEDYEYLLEQASERDLL